MENIAIGIYDDPLNQQQPILNIDLLNHNIAVFGGHMTGKTTFLKTLLIRMNEVSKSSNIIEETYILDFGDSLAEYSKLYNICASFNSSNGENIKRIFKVISDKMESNSRTLSKLGKNFLAYATEKDKSTDSTIQSNLPEIHHITFIVDNANALFSEEDYTIYHDDLLRFCRDGLSKGVTVILTVSDTCIPSKILANFSKKIAFKVDTEKYMEIFGVKTIHPMNFKGRGLVNINSNVLEFQCFLPFRNETEQSKFFDDIKNSNMGENPNFLKSFEDELTFDNLLEYSSIKEVSKNMAVVGLEYYQHNPIGINFDNNRSIAVYGKKHFGKTNLLNLLVKYLVENKNTLFDSTCSFILFDDGKKQLSNINKYLLKSGISNDNIEYVNNFESFNKAIKSRELLNTVFIIQNRTFYNDRTIVLRTFPNLIAQSTTNHDVFIYADIPIIADSDLAIGFNSNISSAFVLDNIGEFVNTKGQRTIFKNMNSKELKEQFAKCELGDGYYYDFDNDDLQKLKFIKHDLSVD